MRPPGSRSNQLVQHEAGDHNVAVGSLESFRGNGRR